MTLCNSFVIKNIFYQRTLHKLVTGEKTIVLAKSAVFGTSIICFLLPYFCIVTKLYITLYNENCQQTSVSVSGGLEKTSAPGPALNILFKYYYKHRYHYNSLKCYTS